MLSLAGILAVRRDVMLESGASLADAERLSEQFQRPPEEWELWRVRPDGQFELQTPAGRVEVLAHPFQSDGNFLAVAGGNAWHHPIHEFNPLTLVRLNRVVELHLFNGRAVDRFLLSPRCWERLNSERAVLRMYDASVESVDESGRLDVG